MDNYELVKAPYINKLTAGRAQVPSLNNGKHGSTHGMALEGAFRFWNAKTKRVEENTFGIVIVPGCTVEALAVNLRQTADKLEKAAQLPPSTKMDELKEAVNMLLVPGVLPADDAGYLTLAAQLLRQLADVPPTKKE